MDQALDIVMRTLHLGAERNNNVLMVDTLRNLTTQKQEELTAKTAAEAVAPRLTRMFPINYADPKTLQTTLQTFTAQMASESRSSASSSVVQIDDRTNSLLVQDTATNLEKMQKLIELLDIQSPQVLIEAKIVEASEEFTKSLGGSLGLGGGMAFSLFLEGILQTPFWVARSAKPPRTEGPSAFLSHLPCRFFQAGLELMRSSI